VILECPDYEPSNWLIEMFAENLEQVSSSTFNFKDVSGVSLDGSVLNRHLYIYKKKEDVAKDLTHRQVEFLQKYALFFNMNCICKIGLFDEKYFLDFEEIDSQGKSIRCYIAKKSNPIKISKKINLFLKKEYFLQKLNTWKKFKKKINLHKKKLRRIILNIKKSNQSISAYGASGKGQSLIQINKIGKYIDYIYDKSELKNNKFSPGYNIKILNPVKINKLKPNYLLLLAWNIKNEILRQEKKFKNSGGKFIIPFPTPYII
jgi:hypothetical protein